ncbi:DUF393 domain-containing protein [Telmatocola sphagniphila]|uniref:DUF393 domain-containing protein n=1 Tax=Telmatocola sphagniphila TaxID=1123043 RepID=A0A8E6ETX2_9BACT|nr:DUF393 domain-containing protein [Telmatocola sphagniphila]QVL30517.1 DUF393 domain-containing protein [Telmatocola sphagniphila]
MTTLTANKLESQACVLFDGDCRFCQKSVALLRKLDWLQRLSFHNARDFDTIPPHTVALDADRLLQEMHVLTPEGTKAFAGFKAFRWIAGRLPALWLIVPFLYIPGVPFLGQKLYLWVARNRYGLVPCHDGQCAVPLKKKK